MQDLVLHVGLPKTGTTSLQKDFFSKFPGYLGSASFLGNSGSHIKSLMQLYDSDERHPDFNSTEWRNSVKDWWEVAQLVSPSTLVISDESLSQWRPASGRKVGPLREPYGESLQVRTENAPLPKFIAALADTLRGRARLRVIITIRNQTDFLASLYAQVAVEIEGASQLDFETKIQHMLRSHDAYADWHALVLDLRSSLGPENLLVCIYEDGLTQIAEQMAHFCDPLFKTSTTIHRHNVRRLSQTTWAWMPNSRFRKVGGITAKVWPPSLAPRFRRLCQSILFKCGLSLFRKQLDRIATRRESMFDKQSIEIDEDLRYEIQAHWQDSNEALGQLLSRDLQPFGY